MGDYERVEHPSHYNTGSIEVWDAIEDWGLDFFLGNVIKYTARAGKKKGESAVEDLLKATLGFVKGIAEAHDKAEGKLKDVCPTCGKKRESFHEDNLLGCPDCWKAFAPDIRERLASTQYGVKHAGRAPESAPRINLCAQLERKLKEAVRRQQFEKAAEIRRRLEELGGRPPAPPSPDSPK